MQPEASHERAQPLRIDVGVARGRCDALMAQKGLHVAQVGSALVEEEGCGGMPQGMESILPLPEVLKCRGTGDGKTGRSGARFQPPRTRSSRIGIT